RDRRVRRGDHARRRVPGAAPLPGRPDRGSVTSAAAHVRVGRMPEIDSPSGVQFHLTAGGHDAVVVEVGGGLRRYAVDGVDMVDSYGTDEVCPGGAGQ